MKKRVVTFTAIFEHDSRPVHLKFVLGEEHGSKYFEGIDFSCRYRNIKKNCDKLWAAFNTIMNRVRDDYDTKGSPLSGRRFIRADMKYCSSKMMFEAEFDAQTRKRPEDIVPPKITRAEKARMKERFGRLVERATSLMA